MQFTIVKGYYWSKELFIKTFRPAVYPENFPNKWRNRRSDWIKFSNTRRMSRNLVAFPRRFGRVRGIPISDRTSLPTDTKGRFADRLKRRYTRKFGKLRSLENPKKEGCICMRPVLNTPACSLATIMPYKYLGSGKKKYECEMIPKGVLLTMTRSK